MKIICYKNYVGLYLYYSRRYLLYSDDILLRSLLEEEADYPQSLLYVYGGKMPSSG